MCNFRYIFISLFSEYQKKLTVRNSETNFDYFDNSKSSVRFRVEALFFYFLVYLQPIHGLIFFSSVDVFILIKCCIFFTWLLVVSDGPLLQFPKNPRTQAISVLVIHDRVPRTFRFSQTQRQQSSRQDVHPIFCKIDRVDMSDSKYLSS